MGGGWAQWYKQAWSAAVAQTSQEWSDSTASGDVAGPPSFAGGGPLCVAYKQALEHAVGHVHTTAPPIRPCTPPPSHTHLPSNAPTPTTAQHTAPLHPASPPTDALAAIAATSATATHSATSHSTRCHARRLISTPYQSERGLAPPPAPPFACGDRGGDRPPPPPPPGRTGGSPVPTLPAAAAAAAGSGGVAGAAPDRYLNWEVGGTRPPTAPAAPTPPAATAAPSPPASGAACVAQAAGCAASAGLEGGAAARPAATKGLATAAVAPAAGGGEAGASPASAARAACASAQASSIDRVWLCRWLGGRWPLPGGAAAALGCCAAWAPLRAAPPAPALLPPVYCRLLSAAGPPPNPAGAGPAQLLGCASSRLLGTPRWNTRPMAARSVRAVGV